MSASLLQITAPHSAVARSHAAIVSRLTPQHSVVRFLRPSLAPSARLSQTRSSTFLAVASRDGSEDHEINVEKGKSNESAEMEDAQEAWKRSLEYFKAEALKVKVMSLEAYEIYSKKAREVLLETSGKLKIHAEKAQKDLNETAREISEEGQQYLSMAARNSPDWTKDIIDTFNSLNELKSLSDVRDYNIGIPYGSFLVTRGFLNFMLTGSIAAIRFGVVLGAAIAACGISSLRLWRDGNRSPLLWKIQAAISSFILLRELLVLTVRGSIFTMVSFLISGAVTAFYIYFIQNEGSKKDPSIEA